MGKVFNTSFAIDIAISYFAFCLLWLFISTMRFASGTMNDTDQVNFASTMQR